MHLFQAQQLYYSRNDLTLLENINFDISKGDILQLVGLNGSGKTTLLKILAGLLKPQVGDVLWQGESIYKNQQNYFQDLFYLGHHRGIKKELTVFENLNFDWKRQKTEDEICQAMTEMNIIQLADKAVKYLSQGQQQRVALAKLLLSQAKLWLLDEPFSSLDAQGAEIIESMIERHCELEGCVVVTTHRPIQWQKMVVQLLEL